MNKENISKEIENISFEIRCLSDGLQNINKQLVNLEMNINKPQRKRYITDTQFSNKKHTIGNLDRTKAKDKECFLFDTFREQHYRS